MNSIVYLSTAHQFASHPGVGCILPSMQYDTVFAQWLDRRRISPAVVKEFKVHAGTHPSFGECIVLPVLSEDGIFSFNKYRRNPLQDLKPKYLYDKGGTIELYGSHLLKDVPEGSVVLWCEGELDALVAWSSNVPAVTSTGGAMSLKPEWAELLRGYDVVLCFDNDEAGAHGMVRALELIPWARIMFLPDRPGVKDISDYVTSGGDLHDLLKGAHGYTNEAEVLDDRSVRAAHWQSTHFHDAFLERKKELAQFEEAKKKRAARGAGMGGELSKDKVLRAKEFPVDSLLEFRDGKATCVWHNEKSGSLHFYKEDNRVFCFGCGKGGDSIDVYKALHRCSFKEAINNLQG